MEALRPDQMQPEYDPLNPMVATNGVPWSQMSLAESNAARTRYLQGITGPASPADYRRLGYGANTEATSLANPGGPGAPGNTNLTGRKTGGLSGGQVRTMTSGFGTANGGTGGDGVPPQPNPDRTQIRLQGPNGQWVFSGNTGEIHDLLKQGYKAIRDDGSVQETRPFQNGFVVDWGGGTFLPIDTVLGGTITQAQLDALNRGGYPTDASALGLSLIDDPGATTPGSVSSTGSGVPPLGTPGGHGAAGYFGNQGATAPGFAPDSDLQYLLRQLIDEARNQGKQGQEAYKGVFEDLKNYLGFARAGAEQTMGKRDELLGGLLGDVRPGIQQAIAGMNDSTGLSPEAMQALRMQATEGTQLDYQSQVEALKTQLAQRGAFGGGDTPGSAGDLIRGYAPLMGARDAQRGNLLAGATLADEQRKFDTLGLNRQTGLGAMGAAGGLAGTIGSAYNPSSFLGANADALQGLLSGIGGMNQSGFTGTQMAGNLAGQWGESQPGSFRNTLLAALAGTGANVAGNVLSGIDWGKVGKSIWDIFKPGSGSGAGGTDPNDPDDFNSFTNAFNRATAQYRTPTYNGSGGTIWNE